MNEIDVKFYSLINIFKNCTYEELLGRIKLNFLTIPEYCQSILQDYFARFTFWGSLDVKRGDFKEIELKALTLKRHYKDFAWLYKRLEDYSSKQLLFAILNNWYIYDFNSLKKAIDYKYKHYFDFDLIPHCKDEVFVDLGAYTGDSVLDYLASYGKDSYKRIYCYEITGEILDTLKANLATLDNIEYRHKAAKDRRAVLYLDKNTDPSSNRTSTKGKEAVECVSLDEDIKEKISLIKMDIEGDELSALKGAKEHIKNDCPKLLISVYHNNDHLWQIPRLIYRYNKDYKFFLRYYGGDLYTTEVVLFALPK